MELAILGTRFVVDAGRPGWLAVTRAFEDAYEHAQLPASRRTAVTIRRSAMPSGGLRSIPVHRSKHRHWTFDGAVQQERPRRVTWPERGVAVDVEPDLSALRVDVADGVDDAFASEAAYHALRGVALYARDTANARLVHAGAVIGRRGAVLFVGGSFSGKTTAATECVLRHGARPLANDRVQLVAGASGVDALSWPSYASFCEGTLRRYDALRRAARAYEVTPPPYRTLRWSADLADAFHRESKRIYPQGWYADAVGARFARRAPVTAIVFVRLDPHVAAPSIETIEADDGADPLAALLDEHAFDAAEPSFMPWHGIAATHDAGGAVAVARAARSAGVAVRRLTANPRELDVLAQLLEI